jgi:mRNA interferase RelE/StbE
MTFAVFILPSAEKDCNRLSRETYDRCRKAILKLEGDPRPAGCKKLVGDDGYRIRVGDYRVLYRIDDSSKRIFIYRVKHRREAYR